MPRPRHPLVGPVKLKCRSARQRWMSRHGAPSPRSFLPPAGRWSCCRAPPTPEAASIPRRGGRGADADCFVVDVGSALAIGNTGLDSRGVLARRCLAAADRIVVVGAADPVGLERVREGAAALPMLPAPPSIEVFVNRVRPRVLGRRPQEHLRTALRGIGGRSVYRLPNDASATDAAPAAAAPLRVVAPRSALRRAIRDYALSLLVR